MCARSATYTAIREFLCTIQEFVSQTPGGVDDSMACRIACADQLVMDSQLCRASDWLLSNSYTQALDAVRGHLENGDEKEVLHQARWYIETMLRWVKKRPFRTQEGHVGLAPGETMEGDIVAIFHGFSAPYVLRKLSGRGRTYELVGECYVCGVMDGEYVDGVDTVEDLYHLV